MATIKFKRGTTGPSGLTLGEPAWDYVNNKLYVGVTSSAIWVGAQIDSSSSLGTSNTKIPTQGAVKAYVDSSVSGSASGVTGLVAGTGIALSGPTGNVTITNTGVQSFNGSTGAVVFNAYVSTFNGSTGAVVFNAYVSSFNGLTGVVTGVASINGSTGAITNVARLNEGNTFSVRQVMNAGITSANLYVSGGVTFNSTSSYTGLANFNGGITSSNLYVSGGVTFTGANTALNSTTTTVTNTSGLLTLTNSYNAGVGTATSKLRMYGNDNDTLNVYNDIVPNNPISSNLTHTLPSTSGTLLNTNFNSYVSTYNGRTGAVQGVSAASAGSGISVSGSTGAITITNVGVTGLVAGTGISISGSTGNVTITNTGVQSFNGSTGAITGVSSVNGFTGAVSITYASAVTVTSSNSTSTLYPVLSFGAGNTALYVDNVTTPLTYVPSTGTLTTRTSISSAGTGSVTTSGPSINTTYTDGTDVAVISNFGFNHNGSVTFNIGSNIGVNVAGNFSISDNAQSSYQLNFPTSAGSSGQVLTTNGAYPATLKWTTISNGLTGMTYDSTNKLYQFGGTGSFEKLGVGLTAPQYTLDINGTANFRSGISGAGATFSGAVISDAGFRISSGAINAQTGTTYSLLSTDNGKIITMNNGSTTTVTIPSGLPVGYNTTVIQLGAGQVGFTGSGTTINSSEGKLNIANRYSAANIISYTTNTFIIAGGLTG